MQQQDSVLPGFSRHDGAVSILSGYYGFTEESTFVHLSKNPELVIPVANQEVQLQKYGGSYHSNMEQQDPAVLAHRFFGGAGVSEALVKDLQASHQYTRFKISGGLESMMYSWAIEDHLSGRRIVQFGITQSNTIICYPVSIHELVPSAGQISCIYSKTRTTSTSQRAT